MQAKMAQIIALEYMRSRLENLNGELMLSNDDGLSADSLDCFQGWFMDFEDFEDWLSRHFAFKQYKKEAQLPWGIMRKLLGLKY